MFRSFHHKFNYVFNYSFYNQLIKCNWRNFFLSIQIKQSAQNMMTCVRHFFVCCVSYILYLIFIYFILNETMHSTINIFVMRRIGNKIYIIIFLVRVRFVCLLACCELFCCCSQLARLLARSLSVSIIFIGTKRWKVHDSALFSISNQIYILK